MKNSLIILFVFLSVVLTACFKTENKLDSSKEIHWFSGGMEKALVQAKAESKPLFVYWGAQWCPPCNVVKSTIFKEPEVVKVTGKFLSVYLDGDTDSAQEWGEKLKASGYPTLMVLNADGKEVVRLDSSSSPKDFALALDSAYNNLYPIEDLMKEVLAQKPDQVSLQQWQLLANFDWSQAESMAETVNFAEAYEKLYHQIPVEHDLEKKQLFLNMLSARLGKLEKQPLTDTEKKDFLAQINQILEDSEKLPKLYKTFAYRAGDIVKAFYPKASEERETFVSQYKQSMAKVRETYKVGSYERLITFYPVIELAKIDDEKASLPEEDRQLVKKEMLAAEAAVQDSHEQVFVTNSASYILAEAGFTDLARETLKKDIEKSKTPYYSMASLADLEKEAGNKEEALKWIERAYNSSQGQATRLQWGSNYLIYLMDIKPEKKKDILLELQKYYSEHLKQADAFMGRNKARLNRISKKVREWSEKNETREQLQTMKSDWLGRCKNASGVKTDYYRESCTKYFSELI